MKLLHQMHYIRFRVYVYTCECVCLSVEFQCFCKCRSRCNHLSEMEMCVCERTKFASHACRFWQYSSNKMEKQSNSLYSSANSHTITQMNTPNSFTATYFSSDFITLFINNLISFFYQNSKRE